jgi:hypothetical protein
VAVRGGIRRRLPRHSRAGRDRRGRTPLRSLQDRPIDDIVHLLSGLAGVVVAAWAVRLVPLYLRLIGILYGLDALVGLVVSRGFLDGSLFTQGPGRLDFGLTNVLINLPHIVLAGIALAAGFSGTGRSRVAQPA